MSTPSYERPAFYATGEYASDYDVSIEAVVPLYSLFQSVLVDMVKATFEEESAPLRILDIGIGSGAESIGLLKAYPNAVIDGVDFADEMKEQFRCRYLEEMGREPWPGGPVTWYPQDFMAMDLSDKSYDLIVTGFTLHHFPPNLKLKAYNRAASCLETGGIFINLDLASFETRAIQREATQFDEAWITRQFETPNPELLQGISIRQLARLSKVDPATRRSLSHQWVVHHQEDNDLDTVENQIRMLRAAGFEHVECPMRFRQISLVWASK